jgi:hypothetical protein
MLVCLEKTLSQPSGRYPVPAAAPPADIPILLGGLCLENTPSQPSGRYPVPAAGPPAGIFTLLGGLPAVMV